MKPERSESGPSFPSVDQTKSRATAAQSHLLSGKCPNSCVIWNEHNDYTSNTLSAADLTGHLDAESFFSYTQC